ncbi:MAG: hypothetical protein H6619_07005 [Deltaproteobacteria bacterium]|nr:hypothetical protein [Deltaproteobacteria bacterium]
MRLSMIVPFAVLTAVLSGCASQKPIEYTDPLPLVIEESNPEPQTIEQLVISALNSSEDPGLVQRSLLNIYLGQYIIVKQTRHDVANAPADPVQQQLMSFEQFMNFVRQLEQMDRADQLAYTAGVPPAEPSGTN